jgi:hypothetical protein
VKKIAAILLVTLTSITGFSQVTISKSTLDYPKTEYKKVSDQLFNIINDFSTDVDIVIRSYNSDFYVDDSTIQIKANSSETVTVHFKPVHNIKYNSELVIITNSKTGSFSIDLKGEGKYDSYYTSTFDLFEQDLKNELKSVVSSGYKNLGYSGARDAMYGSIDNSGGKVECVYTGRQATFNTRSGANSNSFNCEHTWPQSLFNQNEPERADIHHLFPTDVSSNSRRSNFPFGVVSSATWTEGGSKLGGGKFEPRDVHKGDCARAMLYFATRYQNYSSFLTSQESLLRQWAAAFPPNQKSIDRNNAIFSYQKNRNPFVDYPEFLARINSISTTSSASTIHSVSPSESAISINKLNTAGSFTYQLVITNTGNQTELFTGLSNSNSSVTFPKTAFELTPGESKTLNIKITPTTSIINDNIVLTSSDVSLTVPLTVAGLSSILLLKVSELTIALKDQKLHVRNARNYQIAICNSNGQQVYFNEIQSNFTELDVSGLTSGIYFVQAIGRSGTHQVQKILIP